ncbi:SDR family NAD(P)-dependent oxidoreductase [Tenacibaculum aiptasiae]|uniref:SDR family NAD(P)-dependent oxidoreductase n=1 Tax=Tenacibaculum aiptasiae TaxID=426481 RepID=A0A7J5A830_9FLAO|nr:type I polyketide synthase [Tenacibaculum aiptasiae]KAB1153658.1 SDR family NAD(P)-dependent oxidoreductase [Tenacibaculum aiptasiae]
MSNKNKPIAIVGIGCRFPGSSTSAEKFWEMMLNETDTIGNVPADRWNSKKYYSNNDKRSGKIRAEQGGFLTENALDFDSLFFDMSPRESESLDPQQRMLMEVAYEALENAGLSLENVKGSNTGVFVGGFMLDNLVTQTSSKNQYHINSHTISGVAMTMLSNRLSYVFDLKGPSLSIDTACSSSLIATHYACQSIWNGESSMAMVGGVNYMLSPESSILMSKGKFLSKHSRCKAFDSDAAGYVRGEGAGIVILKPLEDAIRDNDRIYATIVGTGANQDGRTNGITVPNPDSQLQLIRKIYKENEIDKNKVHYVEAHGTGTAVGDPIEFGTLNKALSEDGKRDIKCLVGSVKTNIGHLEAASGVAGLIKAALCLNKNQVPANLHFKNPNPALHYEESNLRVPTSLECLPENEDSYASVNSFGFGGANAHVVLKQHNINSIEKEGNSLKTNHFIFPISAKSTTALKELAIEYKNCINENSEEFDQILSNAIYRRTNHSERLSIFGTSRQDLIDKLEAYEEDILLKGVHQGSSLGKKPKVVFIYTGMGPQWWKMGRELMETEPVFKQAIMKCDAEFKIISGWSIYEELIKPEESSMIRETNIAQPANFVIQVGLTKLLAHYGIIPDAVMGHSVGEVASVYASGALTLKEALTVSYYRSSLQHSITQGKGTMLAVGLPESEVEETISKYDNVSIAAVNAPTSVTISGNTESLKKLKEKYDALGVFCRLLDVSVPYHSPLMKLVKEYLLDALKEVKGNETKIDLYSTVTGGLIKGNQIDNNYWYNNVREPVLFSKTIETILEDDYTVFLEVGPHPVLKNSIKECTKNRKDCNLIQTLNKREEEQVNFYENISKLFTLGYPLKWDRWIDKLPFMQIPTYPWQKQYLWRNNNTKTETLSNKISNLSFKEKVHGPSDAYIFELNEFFFPFLNDHIVHEKVVFPGAGYIGIAIDMYLNEVSQEAPFQLENVNFHKVLMIDEDEIQNLYVSMNTKNGSYSIESKNGQEDTDWVRMSSGKFAIGSFREESPEIAINQIFEELTTKVTPEEVYTKLSQSKLDYGPYFRCIKDLRLGGEELVANIVIHEDLEEASKDYFIHPTLLDACFQTTIALANMDVVPVSINKVHCYEAPDKNIFCYSKLKYIDDQSTVTDITICNEEGKVFMLLEGFKCKRLVNNELQSDDFLKKNFFKTEWIKEKESISNPEVHQDTLTYIFTNDYISCLPLKEFVNGSSIILELGNDYKKIEEDHYKINLENIDILNAIYNTSYKEIKLVLMPSLGMSGVHSDLEMSERCLKQVMPLFNIVKAFSENKGGNIKLSILTQGSQKVLEHDIISFPEQSTLHGLGRLIVNELSNCKVELIDIEKSQSKNIFQEQLEIVGKIINTNNVFFKELAIRNGLIYDKSMINLEMDEQMKLETINFEEEPLVLQVPTNPNSQSFYFNPLKCQELKADEVEILVENTVLSKLDCQKLSLKFSNEQIDKTFAEKNLGIECAGTISNIGSDVTRFKVGDKVLAIAPGTFQSYTTTSEHLVVKCPTDLTNGASGVILSYLTAIYCLRDKAGIEKGDKILIHNATNGIGLAAINYAKYVGAEIFVTIESEENKAFLEGLGIKNIYSSTSLEFANHIKKVTNGIGVDIILSSDSGEVAYQNFSSLAPYGVYLDISKKDVISYASKDMRFFNHNLSYLAIDIDRLLTEKKEKTSGLLQEIAANIASRVLAPLPTKNFTIDQLFEAFNEVKDNNTLGNVVIDFSNNPVEVMRKEEGSIKEDGTYLITGGTGGLGMEIAKWLVDKGAMNLALLSRSGLKTKKAILDVKTMKKQGVNVQVYTGDISKLNEMKQIFKNIKESQPELIGIFHGAMVLDDGYLLDMNEDRFLRVLKPKVDGAMNLHYLSKDLSLNNFVVFSSISSLIGNIGQANYVIANSFLDSFAHWRKGMGLPVTTVNLGVLKETGVVSRNENIEKILEGSGINGFTNEQVMKGIDFLIKEKPTQIGFFDLNWNVISKSFGKSGIALFREIDKANINVEEELTEIQIANRETILNLDLIGRNEFIVNLLQKQLGRILKIPTTNINPDKGINLLGVDSILTIELMGMIKESLAVEIAPIEFLTGPSVRQLSTKIIENSFYAFSKEEELV